MSPMGAQSAVPSGFPDREKGIMDPFSTLFFRYSCIPEWHGKDTG